MHICEKYNNLNNFNEIKLINNINNYMDIFKNVPMNIVICINESISKSKIFPQIKNITCYTIDCSDDWKSKQKKLINNTNQCIESCDNNSQYQYEYNEKCYENCSNGFIYDENNKKTHKCKCELDKCFYAQM